MDALPELRFNDKTLVLIRFFRPELGTTVWLSAILQYPAEGLVFGAEQ